MIVTIMKNQNKKYLINILLIALFGGGAIYLSIDSDFSTVATTLSNASIGWIFVCLLLMLWNYMCDGYTLFCFARLHNSAYTYRQGLKNSLSGVFWCGITPFASGGQFAQVYVFNKQGIKPSQSASILLMAFIVYQTILVLFTSVVMIFRFTYYSGLYDNFFYLSFIGFSVNTLIIVTLFTAAKSKKAQSFVSNNVLLFLSKIKIVKNFGDSKAKMNQRIDDFRDELINLQKRKRLLVQTSLIYIIKLFIFYSIPFFVAKALHIDVSTTSFLDFVGLTAFLYLITSFVPIPGASGGSEGIFALLFGPIFSVSTASALLLWRFITYYIGIFVGGAIFALSKEIKKRGD